METIVELFIITGLFIVTTIGFGLAFGFVNAQNSKLIQRNFGWGGICFFGVIGVPVHEISHLIMAVVFGHKIKKVSLFRPKKGKVDGILGYVQHTYHPRLYQKMGNFFIGAAPMITGAFFLKGLLDVQTKAERWPVLSLASVESVLAYAKETAAEVWSIFQMEHMREVSFWVILLCMIGIAVNMNMSKADIKNSSHGIISLFVVTAVIPLIVRAIMQITYEQMAVVYMGVLIQYIAVLFYALIICSLILGVMYLIHCFI